MHKRRATALALVSVTTIAALAGGCGSTANSANEITSDSGVGAKRPEIHAEVLRGTRDYDYDVADSATALAARSDVVLTGTIAGWAAAKSIGEQDERSEYAILKVKVQRVLKGQSKTADGYAYVRLSRGGEVIDARGKAVVNPGAKSTVTTIEELERAAPAGARLVLLGIDLGSASKQAMDAEEDSDTGHPAGVPVLVPAPQGLVFEDTAGGIVSGVADGEPWGWFPSTVARGNQFASLVRALGA